MGLLCVGFLCMKSQVSTVLCPTLCPVSHTLSSAPWFYQYQPPGFLGPPVPGDVRGCPPVYRISLRSPTWTPSCLAVRRKRSQFISALIKRLLCGARLDCSLCLAFVSSSVGHVTETSSFKRF